MINLDKRNIDDLTNEDFTLIQENEKIHDKPLESKPTTFVKDAFKRFVKNKSSVVGAIILGLLILLALFLPIFSTNDITTIRKSEQFLSPKLFNAGFGFWDGTKKYEDIIYDLDNEVPAGFYKPAVIKIKVDSEPTLINKANDYGKNGYVMFVKEGYSKQEAFLKSQTATFTKDGNFILKYILSDEENALGAKLSDYEVYLEYQEAGSTKRLALKDNSNEYGEISINISEKLESAGLDSVNGSIVFGLPHHEGETSDTYILLKNVEVTTSLEGDLKEKLKVINFNDATKMVLTSIVNQIVPEGYWTCSGRKGIFKSEVYYCDFVFDTYANAYDKQQINVPFSDLKEYRKKGLCDFKDTDPVGTFEVLSDKCPIDTIDDVKRSSITGMIIEVKAGAFRYKAYGYKNMPIFLFGTDDKGQDLLKKSFAGLRTSLVLGICTAAFCFAFGLIWGSISGYFGGNVDILMERFCEILSGVPWIVIMTLAILHFGNNFLTFFLALCLTGWMGTAARTRTQFYRFKGREYVLASRTLGSSDFRLIFKHILPNSMGTIVTSSVLMIPSVIFQEATLAYLNLGLRGVNSFGVMMSENQVYLQSSPNLVIFPACIIALMMISFNLFGNGLRDALNPSLKGSE